MLHVREWSVGTFGLGLALQAWSAMVFGLRQHWRVGMMPSMVVRCCCSRVRGAEVDGTEVSVAASVSFLDIRPELIDGLVMAPLWLRATIAWGLSPSETQTCAALWISGLSCNAEICIPSPLFAHLQMFFCKFQSNLHPKLYSSYK